MLQTKDQCRGLLRLPYGKLPGDHFVFSMSTFDIAIQVHCCSIFCKYSIDDYCIRPANKVVILQSSSRTDTGVRASFLNASEDHQN